MKNQEMHSYLEQISNFYEERKTVSMVLNHLERSRFKNGECIMVLDVLEGEIVYKTGFKSLLDREDEELNLQNFVSLFHPEDAPYIHRIGQEFTSFCLENEGLAGEAFLVMSYRLRRKDGSYAKVISQSSPYGLETTGRARMFLFSLSDISFLDHSNVVTFKVLVKGKENHELQKRVYRDYLDLFTGKELMIVHAISEGLQNKDIAKKLEISIHTVATHRKRILKKSKCHSVDELMLFCRRNGVL